MIEGGTRTSKWTDGIMRGYIFIGSHGSVRIGQCKSASIPMREGRKQLLLSIADSKMKCNMQVTD